MAADGTTQPCASRLLRVFFGSCAAGDNGEKEAAVGDSVDRHRWWLLGGVCAIALIITGAWGATTALAQAAAPAAEDVAAGMRIYRQKADCQACHGWAADGHKMESQMPDGANLRVTKLDREKVVMTIKCGIPGKNMITPRSTSTASRRGRDRTPRTGDVSQSASRSVATDIRCDEPSPP